MSKGTGHWGSCASVKVGRTTQECDCSCKYVATEAMLAQSNKGGIKPRAIDIEKAKTEATDFETWRA